MDMSTVTPEIIAVGVAIGALGAAMVGVRVIGWGWRAAMGFLGR